jgi:hypothetical protein
MEPRMIRSAPGHFATCEGEIISPSGKVISRRPDKHGYMRVTLRVGNRLLTRSVARLVAEAWVPGFDPTLTVDHINRNRCDNRACNLRMASIRENSRNRGLQSNNRSGEAGVVWNRASSKWQAQIWVDGKARYLGLHNQYSDAVRVRRQAAEELFGSFAPRVA